MFKKHLAQADLIKLIFMTFANRDLYKKKNHKVRELLIKINNCGYFSLYAQAAQVENYFDDIMWGIRYARASAENRNDNVLGNLFAIENAAHSMNSNLNLEQFNAYAQASMSRSYVPKDPELRAKCLGALSMGYLFRGDLENAGFMMERALENNSRYISEEVNDINWILDKTRRDQWGSYLKSYSASKNSVSSKFN